MIRAGSKGEEKIRKWVQFYAIGSTVFRLSGFPAGTRKPDRLNNRDIEPDGLPSMADF